MTNHQPQAAPTLRFPAEWEPQDAVLLAWPHNLTDWQPLLDQVTRVYIELARQISRFECVVIVTPQPETVRSILIKEGIDLSAIVIIKIATNDTWIRDFGPITVFSGKQPQLLDFTFDGWGNKFTADKDNRVTATLAGTALLKNCHHRKVDLTLEGGSIESDGLGTLLTTSACLLNPNRNPHLSKTAIEKKLRQNLGCNHILWLDHGWLAGDDTDAHIDTLARFGPNETILYVSCDDSADEHYPDLKKMESQLCQFRTKEGKPFHLVPLPWPQAKYAKEGRLPATYANYLVLNGAVLVPVYNDPADDMALKALAGVFPERKVIALDCQTIIRQHGSLHCITMQLPQGTLS